MKNNKLKYGIFTLIIGGVFFLSAYALPNRSLGQAEPIAYRHQYIKTELPQKLTKSKDALKAYGKFLKNSTDGLDNYFTVLDIDKNGTPELIITNSMNGEGSYYTDFYVYTYKNNKVKKIGNAQSWILQYSAENRTLSCVGRPSGYSDFNYIYTIKNGKIKQATLGHSWNWTDDGEVTADVYEINNKEVSKKKYDNYYKKYFSDAEKIAFYSKTNKNIEKYLR